MPKMAQLPRVPQLKNRRQKKEIVAIGQWSFVPVFSPMANDN